MKRALIAAVLSALATAAVLTTLGFGAANKSSTSKKGSKSSSSQTATKPPPTMKEALAEAEKRRAAQQEKLAKALGVSVEKLQSALDAVKKKNLDEAVKDNLLTAEQRDAILACDKAPLTCDRSNLPAYGFGPGFGHFGGPGPGFGFGLKGGPHHFRGGPGDPSGFAEDLATELGISEDKVISALKSTRPQLPEGGLKRFWHGRGGPGRGWGPPPGVDGAAVPAPPPGVDGADAVIEVAPAPTA